MTHTFEDSDGRLVDESLNCLGEILLEPTIVILVWVLEIEDSTPRSDTVQPTFNVESLSLNLTRIQIVSKQCCLIHS